MKILKFVGGGLLQHHNDGSASDYKGEIRRWREHSVTFVFQVLGLHKDLESSALPTDTIVTVFEVNTFN